MKLQYLRHPILTAKKAGSRLSTQAHMWTFAYHGKRRFRGDPRYDLQNVTDGFRVQIDDRADDARYWNEFARHTSGPFRTRDPSAAAIKRVEDGRRFDSGV